MCCGLELRYCFGLGKDDQGDTGGGYDGQGLLRWRPRRGWQRMVASEGLAKLQKLNQVSHYWCPLVLWSRTTTRWLQWIKGSCSLPTRVQTRLLGAEGEVVPPRMEFCPYSAFGSPKSRVNQVHQGLDPLELVYLNLRTSHAKFGSIWMRLGYIWLNLT